MIRRLDREQITLVALSAAWIGLWGTWIPNISASLSQNLFYLAEWSTFLPGVRSGEIRLAPEVLRLAASLGTCALLFAAQNIQPRGLRWAFRAAAALPVIFVLLPPYPDFLQMWWSPSYGARFGAASVLCAGLVISAFGGRIFGGARRIVVAMTGALGIVAAAVALAYLLPPFQTDYAAPLSAGWGCAFFFAGLALGAGAQIAPEGYFRPVEEKQNGPVT